MHVLHPHGTEASAFANIFYLMGLGGLGPASQQKDAAAKWHLISTLMYA